MGYGDNKLRRKDAVGMDVLIDQFIREMKLSSGLNRQRVFEAWDVVSGAARYTVGRFYRDGVLYCTIGSSVVRNQLCFQKAYLIDRMNAYLETDGHFINDGNSRPPIIDLVLK